MKTHKPPTPCRKCPVKQGRVDFVQNPCPDCKANDYKTYEKFATIYEEYNVMLDPMFTKITKLKSK